MRTRRTGGFYTHELLHKPGGSRPHSQTREGHGLESFSRHRDHELLGFEPYVAGVHLDDLASLPLHEIKRRFESEFGPGTESTATASAPANIPGIQPAERHADRLGTRIAEDLPPSQSLGNGQLPRPVQEVAERRLGVDFSGVELRTDAQGEGKALSHNAFAVAEGSNIHFAKGQANLASQRGRMLLGHELAHVAQARAGVAPGGVAQARSFPRIHEQILQALIHSKREDPSFSGVKGLLAGLGKDDAEGLFQRLTSGSKKDDFAVFFNSEANVPAEVREELLAILRSRFGGAAAGATAQGGPSKTTTMPEEPARLAETARGRAPASISASGLRDPNYIERRAVRVGIPLPGGSYRLDLTKQHGGPAIVLPRKDVHLWVDPFFGRTEIFVGPDIYDSEAEARQAAAQFKDVSDASAFALYRGPHGVIFPTTIAETTAPHLIHALRLLQQEEIASGQAVSDLAVELLLLRGAAGGVRALRGARLSEKTTNAASKLVSKASLVSGATSAGANVVTQLVEHGFDFSKWNLSSVALDFVFGTISYSVALNVIKAFPVFGKGAAALATRDKWANGVKQASILGLYATLIGALRAESGNTDTEQTIVNQHAEGVFTSAKGFAIQAYLATAHGLKNFPKGLADPRIAALSGILSFLFKVALRSAMDVAPRHESPPKP